MAGNDNASYYRRRAATELGIAASARNSQVADIHRELGRLHAERAVLEERNAATTEAPR